MCSGKNRTALFLVATIFTHGIAWAQSQDSSVPQQKPTALVGEGKTLPEKVFRGRLLFKSATATQAFSPDGKKEDSGFTLSAGAGAFVVEYGWSDAVSLQLVAPMVAFNKLAIDGAAFQKSSLYAKKYNEFVEAAAAKLVSDGLCLTVSACLSGINENGLSLPFNSVLTLPTGEKLSVKAGVPIKDVAASLVTRAAIPTAGTTGLGDLELGALVALADPVNGLWARDWAVNFSLGAGLRLPTGSFRDVPAAQRPTGRGTVDLGIRSNLDWAASSAIVISWQNQWESMLLPAKKSRTSLLDSTVLNNADVNSPGADNIANSAEFRRDDPRNVGFMKIALSPADVSDALSRVLLNGQFKYDFEPRATLGGVEFSPESHLYSVQAGLTLSALDFFLPVQWDIDYDVPLSGKNRNLAASVLTNTLKIYARF
ncbi:MAG: hypothetical protein ACO3A4_09090 [Silvanigrellaceae bacterium]